MRRKFTAFTLPLAAALLLAAGGPNSTILVDDFNDGDDAGWEREDFTPAQLAIFDASDGSYTLDSGVPVAVDDPSVGTVDAHWIPSIEHPRFANGTVRGTIRANSDGSTVGFLLRTNEDVGTDYGFFGSTSFGTFYIDRFDFASDPDAPQTIIAMADPEASPFVAGETYHLEASAVGHTLTLKAWRVGDPEPATPTLIVTDKGLAPQSGSAICVIAFFDPEPLAEAGVEEVHVSGTFDDITFTPGKPH